ncbi:hypothetical protein GCM10027404_00940 [Arthrobacter tumbae]|uniref:hypothetical protein n=1 Tax=Arthrobacter tumbae TaxID=163874 RepID=UPI001957AA6D|nr:hypothetical protein [Arthrobacter tumbae]MBM7780462.1 hypothetical protein [Arthrobacter tumbae]
MATAWSVTNRTDGLIDGADLPLIPSATAREAAALVSAGLWRVSGSGWTIQDFDSTQTSSAEIERLERKRRNDREYKAKVRAQGKGPDVVPDSRSDVRSDIESDVRSDIESDIGSEVVSDGKGKSKSKSKLQGQQAEPESFAYPEDGKALQVRQWIEGNGITSPAELAEARGMDEAEAVKWWGSAFPGWRAA